ncbi:MAG: rod shape-determining protein MreC [Candidatus Glassbacteria bacterium]
MARLLSLIRYYNELSIFLLFFIICLLLIAIPSRFKLDHIKRFNRYILSPVQMTTVYLASIHDMEEQIDSLRSENARLALELSKSRDLRRENDRLKKLLEFIEESGVGFLPARIVSISLNEPLTTVLIDKGSADGISPYSPLMTTEGLVGKVLEADKHTSLVELFTHPQFRASAVVPSKGEMGIVRSAGSTLLLTGLSANTKINEGDRVVTSGMGGVYPEGIPIGEVVEVTEDEIGIEKVAKVLPYISLSSLFEVAVLLDEAYLDSDTTKLRRAQGSLMWLWDEGNVEERK